MQKMTKSALCAITCVVSTTVVATNWYVDANNGDDGWDGTTAVIPDQVTVEAGGVIHGPRQTLHAMMSDNSVVAGDTIFAAEGDYKEGGAVVGTDQTINRVQVKAGVTLCASGLRDATFITGSGGTYEEGAYSNGAVRCVYFIDPSAEETSAGYGCGIVKGFTLRDGRTANGSANKMYGGASTGAGLLVECDFRNNGCYNESRAGTMYAGTALRCRFSSFARGYLGHEGTKVIDSLIVANGCFYWSCTAYNCTFTGNGYVRKNGTSSKSATYNCLFIGNGAGRSDQKGTPHYNTFSRSNFHATECTTNETCRVVTAVETPYDEMTLQPRIGSVAINAGDISYYVMATNGWKAAWLAECGKDYCGGVRVREGQIDVGAGEYIHKGFILTVR